MQWFVNAIDTDVFSRSVAPTDGADWHHIIYTDETTRRLGAVFLAGDDNTQECWTLPSKYAHQTLTIPFYESE